MPIKFALLNTVPLAVKELKTAGPVTDRFVTEVVAKVLVPVTVRLTAKTEFNVLVESTVKLVPVAIAKFKFCKVDIPETVKLAMVVEPLNTAGPETAREVMVAVAKLDAPVTVNIPLTARPVKAGVEVVVKF